MSKNTTSVLHLATKSCATDVLQPEHFSWTYSIVRRRTNRGSTVYCMQPALKKIHIIFYWKSYIRPLIKKARKNLQTKTGNSN